LALLTGLNYCGQRNKKIFVFFDFCAQLSAFLIDFPFSWAGEFFWINLRIIGKKQRSGLKLSVADNNQR